MGEIYLPNRGVAAPLLAAALLIPTALYAAQPYEGAWVRSARECAQQDGASSLTVIGLDMKIDGKPKATVEQYENHCFIENRSTAGNDTTLKVACFEFWDDFRKKVGPRMATIRLSQVSKDALKIDGKPYLRCPGKDGNKRR